MTHYAFRERDDDLYLGADYVVVGSGAGGASVAVGLARGGASVAIVEAGPWRDPDDLPSSAWAGMRSLMPDWGGTIVQGRALWPVVQGRAVGGTTVINSAIAVRTPGDIFRQWEREHGVGGLAERMRELQDEIEDELYVSRTPDDAMGNSNTLAIEGARAAGYPSHRTHRYIRDCEGTGQCLQGCRAGRKQSLNLNYVPEVMRRGGDVVSCAPVQKVMLRRGRAIGVKGHFVHPESRRKGARFTVRARKAVVVAASTIRTPVLLMRSGVRHPALGSQFRSHPGTAVFGVYDDPVDMNLGATQGWASMAFRQRPGLKLETISVPPELVASRLSGGGTELMRRLREYRHLAMWAMGVRAETAGTISTGLLGAPVVRYTLDRADMERVREGAYLLAKTHFAAGARAVAPGIFGLPYQLGPDQLETIRSAPLDPRCYTAILSHLFGGCPMGADDRRAVCDPKGRVYGVDGLVVADASQIPTNLGVNPQHTIMSLARLRAEQLLA